MKEYLDVIKTATELGGSTVIALAVVFCVYKISCKFCKAFLGFGQAFVDAHSKIAESLSDHAKSMSEMRDGIDRFVAKDNSEHREILLGVQVMGDELKALVCEVRNLREEKEGK